MGVYIYFTKKNNECLEAVFGYVIYASFYHINFTRNPWDAEKAPVFAAIISDDGVYIATTAFSPVNLLKE